MCHEEEEGVKNRCFENCNLNFVRCLFLFPVSRRSDKKILAVFNKIMEVAVSQVYTSISCNRTPEIVDWNSDGLICYGASNAVVIYDTVRIFMAIKYFVKYILLLSTLLRVNNQLYRLITRRSARLVVTLPSVM